MGEIGGVRTMKKSLGQLLKDKVMLRGYRAKILACYNPHIKFNELSRTRQCLDHHLCLYYVANLFDMTVAEMGNIGTPIE